MKILLVQPGASMSTADVCTGLKAGLLRLGHTIYDYQLDARIERAGAWLMYCWKKAGKPEPRPGSPDILYKAGEELIARTLRVMPDVVLVVSAMFLHPDILVMLKRARLNTAVLFTESPYDDARQWRLLPFTDVAWTNERSSAQGPVRYMPHAWNVDVHAQAAADETVPAHQVLFIGTGFEERIDLLEAVDWSGLDLALYGQWDLLGSRNHLRQYLKGEYVDNAYAAKLYQRATIGLNLYRTSMGFGKGAPKTLVGESLNPRAYELAATGCFTVSDYRKEVGEVFGPLVPTFARPEEVRPLLDRWLADEVGRTSIRAALPGAVSAHTWDARAEQVIRDLQGAGIGAGHASEQSAGEGLACMGG